MIWLHYRPPLEADRCYFWSFTFSTSMLFFHSLGIYFIYKSARNVIRPHTAIRWWHAWWGILCLKSFDTVMPGNSECHFYIYIPLLCWSFSGGFGSLAIFQTECLVSHWIRMTYQNYLDYLFLIFLFDSFLHFRVSLPVIGQTTRLPHSLGIYNISATFYFRHISIVSTYGEEKQKAGPLHSRQMMDIHVSISVR